MIDRREILEAASALSLLPSIVEKDYILGWVLAGINSHEELAANWGFQRRDMPQEMLLRNLPFLGGSRFHTTRR